MTAAPSLSDTAPARPASAAPRLSFGGMLASERIKFTSLRSFRITLLITLLAGVGLSSLGALGWSSMMSGQGDPSAAALQGYLLMVSTFSSPFLALIFGVLGVFAISSEYSSGMILSTLSAAPRRSAVYLAKATVLAAISGVTAIVLVLLGLGIGVLFTPAAAGELLSTPVVSGAIGAVLFLVLIALTAFGVATLLRSTAGGISVIVGLTFVLPMAVQILTLTGWEWVPEVSNYLLVSLGNTLSGGLQPAVPEGMGMQGGPGYWVALIAMCIWALVPFVAGLASFNRRDAK